MSSVITITLPGVTIPSLESQLATCPNTPPRLSERNALGYPQSCRFSGHTAAGFREGPAQTSGNLSHASAKPNSEVLPYRDPPRRKTGSRLRGCSLAPWWSPREPCRHEKRRDPLFSHQAVAGPLLVRIRLYPRRNNENSYARVASMTASHRRRRRSGFSAPAAAKAPFCAATAYCRQTESQPISRLTNSCRSNTRNCYPGSPSGAPPSAPWLRRADLRDRTGMLRSPLYKKRDLCRRFPRQS